jgi:cyclohexanone monooxygenase
VRLKFLRSSDGNGTMTATTFDPDALRAKYREERDKRLRGPTATTSTRGDRRASRASSTIPTSSRGSTASRSTTTVEVAVIGGGFGGLLAGARLRQAGVDDIRILEKGGDFGGTWYWNRYPGAQCDVESYIYLPLLEELGYMPTEKYARAPEILAHSQAIGRHFDLYRGALFQTEVTELRWDEAAARWILATNRGDRLRARFVCMPNGPLNRPKLPGIPGIESFAGHTFHTSRWDYDYTGGDSDGGLDGTARQARRHHRHGRDRRAVRAAPRRQRASSSTCSSARRRRSTCAATDRPIPSGREPRARLAAARRMDNFNNLVSGGYQAEDLVDDGWTDIIGKLLVIRAAGATGDMRPILSRRRWSSPTSRRWSRSARAWRRSSTTRRPPRR